MSAIACFFLLLLCISLSLHACCGRQVAVASDLNHEKNGRSSNLNDQKEMSVTSRVETNSSSSEGGLATEGKMAETNQLSDDTNQMIKDSSLAKPMQKAREGSKKSVAWRVPQNKRREKHLAFNLDYWLPNTHPPSHN